VSNDYPAFAKIPRLFRDIVITEKIDGTNGLIHVEAVGSYWDDRTMEDHFAYVQGPDGLTLAVRAGSRNRWIHPGDDNFGFAEWVHANADGLARLGLGGHYGEWWGAGIQRRYGLTGNDKRFSLFNTGRWNKDNIPDVPGLGVVPVLYAGPNAADPADWPYLEQPVDVALYKLRGCGSHTVPGFMRPEGVIVYHTAAHTYSKVTLDNDEAPKGNAT
jgi:hypothetical protein